MAKMKKERNWWKMIAVNLIIILLVILGLKSCSNKMSNAQSVPENYISKVETGGALEAKYLAMGTHETSYVEYGALMSFEKYEIYYPSDMDKISTPLPVVVFVNGTGVPGSKYQALQKHMASWGFITIATEEDYAWNGFSAEMSVRFLKMLNETNGEYYGKENIFYGKIDTDNIGITGHSQGGYGVINAITDQRNKNSYKASVILSSAPSLKNNDFLWDADSSKISTPTMFISTTGQFDQIVASLPLLTEEYNKISNDVDKVLMRQNSGDHGDMLYTGDGYVTAWFMYYLQGDAEAKDAFFGANAEINNNSKYQDILVNQSENN